MTRTKTKRLAKTEIQ